MFVLLLFGIAAYYDWKKHYVPDWINVLLWLWIAIYGNANAAAAIFALLFGTTLLFRGLFGWADVLSGPAYFLSIPYMPLATLGFCLPIFLSSILKKEIPCFPFYFAALFLSVSLSIFKYL